MKDVFTAESGRRKNAVLYTAFWNLLTEICSGISGSSGRVVFCREAFCGRAVFCREAFCGRVVFCNEDFFDRVCCRGWGGIMQYRSGSGDQDRAAAILTFYSGLAGTNLQICPAIGTDSLFDFHILYSPPYDG